MSNNDIKRINKDLANDFLPVELDFTMKPTPNIDWEKVAYNTFYKSQEYFINKFPPGFESLPGYEKIIDEMILNSKTPLEEMNERRQDAVNKIWEESINNLSIENIDIDEQENQTV